MNKCHRFHKCLFLPIVCILVLILLLPGCGGKEAVPDTSAPETSKPPQETTTPGTTPDTTTSPPSTPGTTPAPETIVIPPPPQTPDIPEGTPAGWQGTYTEIYSNDFESTTYPGVIVNGELITEGVLDGKTSVKLPQHQGIETDPSLLPLAGDNYYIFEFDYQLLNTGPEMVLWINLRPEGSTEESDSVVPFGLLPNAEPRGTCSFGVLTPDAPNYYLTLYAATGTDIIIDNLRIFRLDSIPITSPPDNWAKLAELPYPRLGKFQLGHPYHWAADGTGMAPDWPEGEPVYKLKDCLEWLSLFDVVGGPAVKSQTMETYFVKRLRELNPDMVILPYTIYAETDCYLEPPHATIDLTYDFYSNLTKQWVMKDSLGNIPECVGYPGQLMLNIFDSCPLVDGQSYTDAIFGHMVNKVMASGLWDGIFIDNTIPKISHYIPDYQNPSLIDFDINLNEERDETPAQISEATREAWLGFLQRLRAKVGDNEIIIGNCGFTPHGSIAPYLSGFLFEIFQNPWFCFSPQQPDEGAWRSTLDLYFMAQERTMAPNLNVLEGSGRPCEGSLMGETDRNYLEPTTEDIYRQRLGMGTALLGDGFYAYDLYDNRSVPYWFDEYMVNDEGVAVEDPQYKGYLGMPLGDAAELASPATLIWEADFDDGRLPSEMEADPEVSVSQDRLVIDNPDHTSYQQQAKVNTKAGQIPFQKGNTYVVELDWEVLETIDDRFSITVSGSEDKLGSYGLPEVFAGESGSIRFPVTLNHGSSFKLELALYSGGGKVAIDNIKIYEGGAGPWRRDFENGFVLVNPLNKAYTFSTEELAGEFDRTGIKRILGTQAPEVNNGQPVTDTLTLEPFDAIILLAAHASSR
jgi:hypothetical protein